MFLYMNYTCSIHYSIHDMYRTRMVIVLNMLRTCFIHGYYKVIHDMYEVMYDSCMVHVFSCIGPCLYMKCTWPLYMTLYMTLYMAIHGYTWNHVYIHDHTWPYMKSCIHTWTIHGYTCPYMMGILLMCQVEPLNLWIWPGAMGP